MSKSSNSWQRLVQFAGAHMHEEVGDDRLDRAVKIAAGGLAPNPPFVDATFEIVAPECELLASAISKEGMVAWLLGTPTEPDRSITSLRLVTWKDGVKTETQLPNYQIPDIKTFEASIWFPEGSTQPLVLVDGRYVRWIHNARLIEYTFKDRVSELVVFFDDFGLRRFAWRVEGKAFENFIEMENEPIPRYLSDHYCSWLGLVDGSPTKITDEDSDDGVVETLHWKNIHFRMPHPRQHIVPETISAADGGIQFIARRKDSTVFWTDGSKTQQVDVVNNLPLLFDRGEIYTVERENIEKSHLVRFKKGVFERVGQSAMNQCWPRLDDKTRAMVIGNTVVIHNLHKPEVRVTNDILCLVTPPQRTAVVSTFFINNIGRFHNWLVFGNKDGTFTFHIALADAVMRPIADASYPLYGQLFDRLTQVQDERGKAIMSWVCTDDTIHILRYPLPSR